MVCPLRIDKLVAVKRRATRWINRSDDDYDTRRSKLKLLSLSDRRFIRDVTILFNVIYGHLTIGSCFSVHYRVMEHAGSLESTKEA